MVKKVVATTTKSGVVLTLGRAAECAPVCVAVEPEVPAVRLPEAPLPVAPAPDAPALPEGEAEAEGVPKSCADEKVWQLEEAGRVGVYGGVGATPSGPWNQVVVAPLVVKTPGGVIS